MTFWLFAFVGIGLLALEFFASKSNKLASTCTNLNRQWHFVYKFRWIFGVLFAIASIFAIYPMSGYDFIGFPFIAGAFAKNGADFIGPFTIPALFANAITWYFLPTLALWVWQRFSTKTVGKMG
jgi:hypothetical protein